MIDTSLFLERFLQNYRFKMIKSYLIGDVLDFGGNKGELKKYVSAKYLVVNYNHSKMDNSHFDTIVCLAVIEHLEIKDVYDIFLKFKIILNNGGRIILTTPTKIAKPVLDFFAMLRIIDKENIKEHKHYWNASEIKDLALKTGFIVKKYKTFQFGFNQFAIFEHKK